MPDEAPLDWSVADEEDDAFLMSDLYPQDTGLPMTVWVNVKGGARHDVCVKVSMRHGSRATLGELAVVSVRPEPHLLHGDLSTSDLKQVIAWIRLNEDVIVDHWDGRASSAELIRRLQSLPD